MPRSHAPIPNPDPRLTRLLWQWFTLGALAVAVFPAARGYGVWLGWLPFWALIAPLTALAVLHRQVLTAAWRGVLVPAPRRRRSASAQARRPGFGPLLRKKPQRAA